MCLLGFSLKTATDMSPPLVSSSGLLLWSPPRVSSSREPPLVSSSGLLLGSPPLVSSSDHASWLNIHAAGAEQRRDGASSLPLFLSSSLMSPSDHISPESRVFLSSCHASPPLPRESNPQPPDPTQTRQPVTVWFSIAVFCFCLVEAPFYLKKKMFLRRKLCGDALTGRQQRDTSSVLHVVIAVNSCIDKINKRETSVQREEQQSAVLAENTDLFYLFKLY